MDLQEKYVAAWLWRPTSMFYVMDKAKTNRSEYLCVNLQGILLVLSRKNWTAIS